jgi:hypothetical protein
LSPLRDGACERQSDQRKNAKWGSDVGGITGETPTDPVVSFGRLKEKQEGYSVQEREREMSQGNGPKGPSEERH